MTDPERAAGWADYYEKLRDRPPRHTVLTALQSFGAPPPGHLAVDLGCGDGRDVVEMLRRGWRVVAVDAEPMALRQLQARPDMPAGAEVTPVVGRFEQVALPPGFIWLNSSFALPLCAPADFHHLWCDIRNGLLPGGRFSGQWYGERDSWAGRPGITFIARQEARELLDGLEIEMFEEEEVDRVTPRGNPKHWHIFHIVARKP
jgi:SAM-dependent methyltransferase